MVVLKLLQDFSYEQEVGGRFRPFDTTWNLWYNRLGSEGSGNRKIHISGYN